MENDNVIGNNVNIIAELFSDDGNKKFTYKNECKIEESLKIYKKKEYADGKNNER